MIGGMDHMMSGKMIEMISNEDMINLVNIINYLQLLVLQKAIDLEILLYGGLYIFSCNKIC
jgi:hypothetical protein